MLTEHRVQTRWGTKRIKVFCGDLKDLPQGVDLLVCSAFWRDYTPVRNTLIGSLWWDYGIPVQTLSKKPELDLADLGVWVSGKLDQPMFGRIACVEMDHSVAGGITQSGLRDLYDTLFFSIKKCRQKGMAVRSAAMHILGTGNQGIPLKTSLIPLLTESLSALENIEELETILFFDRKPRKCDEIVRTLEEWTRNTRTDMAFISYSHRDAAVADIIANGLEAKGIKPWIDHRMIRNSDYAEDIVKGISESRAFLVLVSENSMQSPDVLREVRNASVYADRQTLKIWPVLLKKIPYPGKFAYYLEGLDYIDISAPPVEERAIDMCGTVHDRLARL